MEELIYQFLLHAGYPRDSLISDLSELQLSQTKDAIADVPSFAVVDPNSSDCLAVINVIAVNNEHSLQQQVLLTRQSAQQIDQEVQGFVILVDFAATDHANQVQFYRVWPGNGIEELSARTFPDFDSLKRSRALALSEAISLDFAEELNPHRSHGANQRRSSQPRAGQPRNRRPGKRKNRTLSLIWVYLPAVALIFLLVLDWFVERVTGMGVISGAQSNLAVGIALLLTIPAAIHYLGAVSNQPN